MIKQLYQDVKKTRKTVTYRTFLKHEGIADILESLVLHQHFTNVSKIRVASSFPLLTLFNELFSRCRCTITSTRSMRDLLRCQLNSTFVLSRAAAVQSSLMFLCLSKSSKVVFVIENSFEIMPMDHHHSSSHKSYICRRHNCDPKHQ